MANSNDDSGDPNAATSAVVFGRTKALTEEDLEEANRDDSTPRCTKMLNEINARTANLDAAARRLKGGPADTLAT